MYTSFFTLPLLCQYNNIYTSLHKYLKEKQKKNRLLEEEKKKKTLGTVATVQWLTKPKSL